MTMETTKMVKPTILSPKVNKAECVFPALKRLSNDDKLVCVKEICNKNVEKNEIVAGKEIEINANDNLMGKKGRPRGRPRKN